MGREDILESNWGYSSILKLCVVGLEKRGEARSAGRSEGGVKGDHMLRLLVPFLLGCGLSCPPSGKAQGPGRDEQEGPEGQNKESPGPNSLLSAHPHLLGSLVYPSRLRAPGPRAHLAVSHGPGDVSPELQGPPSV